LSDAAGNETFFYESSYSVGIAECINTIGRHEMIGISNTLFLKAKAWELLSLMIRQFCDGTSGTADSHQMSLRRRDITALQKARTQLIKNLKSPPTIHELSRTVGLNRNKLQSGFKHLYGCTINSYLRDARLNRAKMLLMEEERQIAEVAEEVGYTNSSQFSKRFKEKFGMLPSEYVRAMYDGEEKEVC
jgi:AraC-like DNA-binding protein